MDRIVIHIDYYIIYLIPILLFIIIIFNTNID